MMYMKNNYTNTHLSVGSDLVKIIMRGSTLPSSDTHATTVWWRPLNNWKRKPKWCRYCYNWQMISLQWKFDSDIFLQLTCHERPFRPHLAYNTPSGDQIVAHTHFIHFPSAFRWDVIPWANILEKQIKIITRYICKHTYISNYISIHKSLYLACTCIQCCREWHTCNINKILGLLTVTTAIWGKVAVRRNLWCWRM